ncbi:dihydroceramide fatty acyl 2-hydroxylase FAH2 [Drosophila sechellia]|uniref:Fatty acid 2-hydroxylase n=1 Tax=Drosophila sechellia TaxID=7238 RepID=B4HQU7_DROSE|nr:dihydroceramide fatty acyl 2-hydroxylase FAH2 [Drosophila sechellia]EDW46757.1 GM20795 [Drosophila sechellia]
MPSDMDMPKEAESNDKFIVKYRQQYYDLSRFMHKHPGGINTLKGLNSGDMTARFLKAPPHSDAAMYLMREYKIDPEDSGKPKSSQRETLHPDKDETLRQRPTEDTEDKNNNQVDESMEHLVDWSKAMLPQIANITDCYDEWVHKPVDRPLRLFEPWYLEMCTKTPWWLVPLFWIPVIVKCALEEFTSAWQDSNQLAVFTGYLLFGVLLWSFLEYTLHRWVFHVKLSSKTGSWLCTFHFMIHGLHHKVPFDPMRLVFPPLPGAVLAAIIYTPLSFVLSHPRVVLSGALAGYLCYDMMHYYLHYGNPSLGAFVHMKRYHHHHHFSHQTLGYGISSPLWDVVFKTRIHLRKLRYQLRWS